MSQWKKLDCIRQQMYREINIEEKTPLRVADELRCKFHMGLCVCVYVIVSGWALNEKFGLEFKLSCREQNGLQDKKKILVARKK